MGSKAKHESRRRAGESVAGADNNDLSGRLFLAIDLPAPIREQLTSALAKHLETAPGRAVVARNWHLTLKFLGDVHMNRLERLLEELRRVPPLQPFDVGLGLLGAFPKPKRARVVWVGVDDPARKLTRLAAMVRDATVKAGFGEDTKPFKGHITVRRLRRPSDVAPFVKSWVPLPLSFVVDRFVLYRSHLGSGPPTYQPIWTSETGGHT